MIQYRHLSALCHWTVKTRSHITHITLVCMLHIQISHISTHSTWSPFVTFCKTSIYFVQVEAVILCLSTGVHSWVSIKNVLHEIDDQQVNRLVSFSSPELQYYRSRAYQGHVLPDGWMQWKDFVRRPRRRIIIIIIIIICSVLVGLRPAVCAQLVLADEVWSCWGPIFSHFCVLNYGYSGC